MAVSEAPQFGHQLKDVTLDEAQPAHFETTLTPVNDATMKVILIFNWYDWIVVICYVFVALSGTMQFSFW